MIYIYTYIHIYIYICFIFVRENYDHAFFSIYSMRQTEDPPFSFAVTDLLEIRHSGGNLAHMLFENSSKMMVVA